MPRTARPCAVCGKSFVPYKGDGKYCSKECAAQAQKARRRMDREPRDCAVCGTSFEPTKSHQRFCSRQCRQAAAAARETGFPLEDGDKMARLKALDRLLMAKGIDLDELAEAQVERVKFYEQGYKDAEGVGQVQQLAGITISPAWESGPSWPVVQPAPAPAVKAPKVKAVGLLKGWKIAVGLPDIQIGYWREPETGVLEPTHDEAAIAVARQIIRDVCPDRVFMHGDNLDFPEFSRYRKTPTFAQTTQATVDRGAQLCAEVRDDAPQADIDWEEGNHELRLSSFVIDNATAAFGLRRPGDNWPVLSIPHLCHLDDYGITYHAGYPANDLWLNDNLRVIHGHRVNSRGATGPRYLDEERVSVIYGHIHRREVVERTRHTHNGPRTIIAASFGCLCRIDGVVPSTKGGTDLFGRPIAHAEDWQQGVGIVYYQPRDDGKFAVESVAIWDGWAMHQGKEYRAA